MDIRVDSGSFPPESTLCKLAGTSAAVESETAIKDCNYL